MKARLILENGMIFEGNAFGHLKESVGEVVFTTGMTGYQEVLTDPSYYGQIVTMTYPLIGNYGINLEDSESKSPKVKGFIVRENCHFPNNFRCEMQLDDYLKQNKIIGLEGIDTRALTKILRNNGTMKGIISLESESLDEVKEKIECFSNKEAVKSVSTKNSYTIEGSGKHVAIIDFGIKANIIRNFKKRRGRNATFLVENSMGSTCYLRCYIINMFDRDENYDTIGVQSSFLDDVFRYQYNYIDMVRQGINFSLEPKEVYKIPFSMQDRQYELSFLI